MKYHIVDFGRIGIGTTPPMRKKVTLTDENICGTKLGEGETLVYQIEGKKIVYITNKNGILRSKEVLV